MTFQFHSRDEADTRRLGQALGRALFDGAVVALNGPLGAGKTRLVQAVAEARGHDVSEVVSPTFTLVHEYRGPRPVYHFDAYRLRDDDEFLNLGPDEYFDGAGVSLVEWAEKVERCLPAQRLEIVLSLTSPAGGREIQVRALGPAYEAVLEALCREFPNSRSDGNA